MTHFPFTLKPCFLILVVFTVLQPRTRVLTSMHFHKNLLPKRRGASRLSATETIRECRDTTFASPADRSAWSFAPRNMLGRICRSSNHECVELRASQACQLEAQSPHHECVELRTSPLSLDQFKSLTWTVRGVLFRPDSLGTYLG